MAEKSEEEVILDGLLGVDESAQSDLFSELKGVSEIIGTLEKNLLAKT